MFLIISMIRTKNVSHKKESSKVFKMPDAINASMSTSYALTPNTTLRNPEMSLKAKGLLGLLLGNTEGWVSYQKTLLTYIKESKDALLTGLQELETFGYLIRLQYQSVTTGRKSGSFWSYTNTPYHFNLASHFEKMTLAGYELTPSSASKYRDMYKMSSGVGFSGVGKHASNNNNIKKNIKNKKFEKFWILYDKKLGHKSKAAKYFNDLSTKEQKTILKVLPAWLKTIGKNKMYRPYPTSFLYQRRWEDDIKEHMNGHTHKSAKSKEIQIPPIDIIRKRTGGYYRIVKKTHDQLFDKDFHNFIDKIEFSSSDGAVALCDLEDGIKRIRKDKVKIVRKYNDQIKSPSIVVSEYVWWLKQQDWLDNISVKLFTSDHKLFKRFVKQESNNNGRNILTGGYN